MNQYVHVVPVGPARGKRVRRRWDLPGGDGGLSTTSQGKQIMPEAARKVVRFFFEEVGANRIYAGRDVNNPRRGRVMQKLGMRCSYVQVRPERFPVAMIPPDRPLSGLIRGFFLLFFEDSYDIMEQIPWKCALVLLIYIKRSNLFPAKCRGTRSHRLAIQGRSEHEEAFDCHRQHGHHGCHIGLCCALFQV